MRVIVFPILVVATAVICAGCSSSGGSPGASSGGSPNTHSANGTPTTTTTASTPSSAASGIGGGISITGAFTAKATITLCTSDIGSIAIHVDGDSETYRGSISARSFGFVGPKAADFTLKSGSAKPTASADGTSFTVKGAELTDQVSGSTITATGTVSCP